MNQNQFEQNQQQINPNTNNNQLNQQQIQQGNLINCGPNCTNKYYTKNIEKLV